MFRERVKERATTLMKDKIELDNMILAVTAADKRKIKKIGITIKTST